MEKQEIKHKALSGIIWQTAQKFLTKLVSLTVSILLARLLDPTEFGIVALTSIFMTLAGIFADSGLGVSLVQKKDIDHLDNNTVFFFGLGLSCILYLILFFCAPLISRLYDKPQLIEIIRILGLNLLLSSISSVQGSLVSRNLDYKKFFFVSLIATTISGIVGVTVALVGGGVWALVAQSLSASFVSVITMNRLVKWLPKLEFSWRRLKQLYAFGLNYMGTNLIGSFFNELRGFLIGIKYQPADLAFYNRGESIPSFISGTINGTISGVLFPAMSRLQDNKNDVKTTIRRAMMSSAFLMAPMMFLMVATANNVIVLLYSNKWAAAIPFMQIVSLNYLFSIIGNANLQALNAIGRSDITLKLEFIKKPIYLAMLLYTMTISPLAMAIGNAIYALIAAAINASPNKKLICYSYREQLRDIIPQILLGGTIGTLVFFLGKLSINIYLLLALQLITGTGLYLLCAKLINLESYRYLRNTIIDYYKHSIRK